MKFFWFTFGGCFLSFGIIITMALINDDGIQNYFGSFMAAGIFLFCGIGSFVIALKDSFKDFTGNQLGQKYLAKIYGYHYDYGMLVNGKPLLVVEARYFDEAGFEQRALIETRTTSAGPFEVGKTVTVSKMKNKFFADPNTICDDKLYAEELLMDDISTWEPIHFVATKCKNCGASLYQADGFIYKCAYCNSYGSLEHKRGSLQEYERRQKVE